MGREPRQADYPEDITFPDPEKYDDITYNDAFGALPADAAGLEAVLADEESAYAEVYSEEVSVTEVPSEIETDSIPWHLGDTEMGDIDQNSLVHTLTVVATDSEGTVFTSQQVIPVKIDRRTVSGGYWPYVRMHTWQYPMLPPSSSNAARTYFRPIQAPRLLGRTIHSILLV